MTTKSKIKLDPAELLILNGTKEVDQISTEEIASGVENGTKVGVKPPPPPRS